MENQLPIASSSFSRFRDAGLDRRLQKHAADGTVLVRRGPMDNDAFKISWKWLELHLQDVIPNVR